MSAADGIVISGAKAKVKDSTAAGNGGVGIHMQQGNRVGLLGNLLLDNDSFGILPRGA